MKNQSDIAVMLLSTSVRFSSSISDHLLLHSCVFSCIYCCHHLVLSYLLWPSLINSHFIFFAGMKNNADTFLYTHLFIKDNFDIDNYWLFACQEPHGHCDNHSLKPFLSDWSYNLFPNFLASLDHVTFLANKKTNSKITLNCHLHWMTFNSFCNHFDPSTLHSK